MLHNTVLFFGIFSIIYAGPLFPTHTQTKDSITKSPIYSSQRYGNIKSETTLAKEIVTIATTSHPTPVTPAPIPRPKTINNSPKRRRRKANILPTQQVSYRFHSKEHPLRIRLVTIASRLIDTEVAGVNGRERRQRRRRRQNGNAKQMLASGHSGPGQHGRNKRYAYEDTYDWDYESAELDYELEEKSDIEKFLDDWHTEGIKLVGILCVFMCCFCTVCCVCRTALRSIWNSCSARCQACGDRLRCRDPSYRKFCKAAGPFGLKMSYKDYKRLKGHYTEYAMNKYGSDAPQIF